MRRTLLSLATLSLTACGPLYIEAQVSALCQKLPRQTFKVPALAAGVPREISMSQDFAFDLAVQAPQLKDLDQSVKFSYVAVTAAGDTKDLGFADSASVTLHPPAGTALGALEFAWSKTTAAPTRIAMQKEGLELKPWLDGGVLAYSVTFVGHVPEEDVTVDIEACADVTVKQTW